MKPVVYLNPLWLLFGEPATAIKPKLKAQGGGNLDQDVEILRALRRIEERLDKLQGLVWVFAFSFIAYIVAPYTPSWFTPLASFAILAVMMLYWIARLAADAIQTRDWEGLAVPGLLIAVLAYTIGWFFDMLPSPLQWFRAFR